jgi:hypothetical protein
MELFIGVWPGKRENRQGYWLRWWNQDGNLLLWGSELVQQERIAKEQERLAKEQERIAKEQERLAKEQERLAKETAQQEANQERLAKETALKRLQELEKRLRDAGISD